MHLSRVVGDWQTSSPKHILLSCHVNIDNLYIKLPFSLLSWNAVYQNQTKQLTVSQRLWHSCIDRPSLLACQIGVVLLSTYIPRSKRKPNDCMVCRAILHELGAQQCHRKPKVEYGAAGFTRSGVWPHVSHPFGCLCMPWFWSNLTFKYIQKWSFLWSCGFEKAYHIVKTHTTWPKGIQNGHVVCPYILYDTYQMLLYVLGYWPWHSVLQTDTSPFRLSFSVDDKKSIFTCPVSDVSFRHGWAHAFLWTTKFQSGQINPKSYLPNWAIKVCWPVCITAGIVPVCMVMLNSQQNQNGSCVNSQLN